MTRLSITIMTLTLLATTAHAQPSLTLSLTQDERDVLAEGEISDGAAIGGKVTSIMFGLGVGQAVEGRYWKTGWIFTLADMASGGLTAGAVIEAWSYDCDASCNHRAAALLAAGAVVGVVSRAAQIYDAFVAPGKHNRRVRELRMRVGAPAFTRVTPYVLPSDGGGSAGIALRW